MVQTICVERRSWKGVEGVESRLELMGGSRSQIPLKTGIPEQGGSFMLLHRLEEIGRCQNFSKK